jgi:hypothetical protein
LPIQAQAGLIDTKCSNSGATLSQGGTKYTCKNNGGKLKWQKAPSLTNAQALALYNKCVKDMADVG